MMWPVLDEFLSASSESMRAKKEEDTKKDESREKPKSADKYVGRPNKQLKGSYQLL